jgi:hypothetical protein
MKIEIETKDHFSIGMFLLEADVKSLFDVVSSCATKNTHIKFDNGLTLWFYCNKHDVENPIYSVAVFNKGRKVYYGEFHYSNLIMVLNDAISEYKRYYSTHYTGR